ncbi:methyl-accepting chemotaxis protein [Scatolibacter rhodanostii]|uniref:methyl-accepting chemotaxis protein n=1 Tax=Scatolibacter rhodanostii TaxID=2014781 RepID=UPI000C08706B|nr:methyl-accepting chemotaxis protein [Scatolibacter rhodanostii]
MKKVKKSKKIKQNFSLGQSLPVHQRLGFRIVILAVVGILIMAAFSTTYLSLSYEKVINDLDTDNSRKTLTTVNSIFKDYELKSFQTAKNLASDKSIVSAVQTGNENGTKTTAQLMIERLSMDVDFVTITDAEGTVVARTHSDEVGDSISDQGDISLAMQGKTSTEIDFGSEFKLSIRTGAPVLSPSGKVLGVVSAGYSLVKPEFVDNMKEITGSDITIFIGDERVNTTIIENNERAVGTKLDAGIAKTILQEGKEYFGEASILGKPYATAYEPLTNSTGEIIGILFAGMSLEHSKAAVRNTSIFSASVSILVAGLMSLITTYFIRKLVSKPLRKMSEVATELSKGNLHAEINYSAKDEVGVLAKALSNMASFLRSYILDISSKMKQLSEKDMNLQVDLDYIGDFAPIKTAMMGVSESLSEILSHIHVTAEQVSQGAEQVAGAAQSLASGTTEQAASIQELTASVTAVAGQAQKNAENVRQATEHVISTGEGVDLVNQKMDDLTVAMQDIKTSSDKIKDITKTIEDIAFQTNILALNAAVEAARAGEAGKGFAVVADEVRSLAVKSAEAAKQAAELIDYSSSAVLKGSKMTQETDKILKDIEEKTSLVIEAVKQIEISSEEQFNTIEQINTGLSQVSDVVQTNAATAEESSASSEELAAQAQSLKQDVREFNLAETDLYE